MLLRSNAGEPTGVDSKLKYRPNVWSLAAAALGVGTSAVVSLI